MIRRHEHARHLGTAALSAVLMVVGMVGCPLPIRPSDPDQCPEGSARVCTGACAPVASTAGAACSLDTCAADARVCGSSLACVPDAANPGQGTCQPTSSGCDPDAEPGSETNRCPQQTRCVRVGTREQLNAGQVCISFNNNPQSQKGICMPGLQDGSQCDAGWEQASAAGNHVCKACALGLACEQGVCRRACPNGRADCPRDVVNQGDRNFTYACQQVPTLSYPVCTTCSPLQTQCGTQRRTDGPSGACCTPGAQCQQGPSGASLCCLPTGQSGCNTGADCCGTANCNAGTCEACGARDQACCSGRSDDCFEAGQECISARCQSCGANGQRTCPTNPCRQPGTQPFPDGICRLCGADGQQACPGNTCQPGAQLFPDGLCHPCGTDNQRACPAVPYCTQAGTQRFPDGLCHLCGTDNQRVCPTPPTCTQPGTQPFSDGICHSCGTQSARCCPSGAQCSSGLQCGGDGRCQAPPPPCGIANNACCSGRVCSGEGLYCNALNVCASCGHLNEPCCIAAFGWACTNVGRTEVLACSGSSSTNPGICVVPQ